MPAASNDRALTPEENARFEQIWNEIRELDQMVPQRLSELVVSTGQSICEIANQDQLSPPVVLAAVSWLVGVVARTHMQCAAVAEFDEADALTEMLNWLDMAVRCRVLAFITQEMRAAKN